MKHTTDDVFFSHIRLHGKENQIYMNLDYIYASFGDVYINYLNIDSSTEEMTLLQINAFCDFIVCSVCNAWTLYKKIKSA